MKKGSKHSPESIDKIKANNARKGKKFIFSETHRQNLSDANKGQVSWIKGRKQSLEHIKNRVENRIKNGNYSHQPCGEDHYLWKRDRNSLKKYNRHGDSAYREWRIQVYRRDNFKCKIRNKDCSGRIEAHHILPWSNFLELRYEVNNGITLCHFHHPRKRNEEKRLSPYFISLITKV